MSEYLLQRLVEPAGSIRDVPVVIDDPLAGEDLHLSLYCCYELHYRGFAGVDEEWEWNPSLLEVRRGMERAFEEAVRAAIPQPRSCGSLEEDLRRIVSEDGAPSIAAYLEERATAEHFREFLVHRSAYQLKEADPHTWAIPRLAGRPKAALVEIQTEEYGEGRVDDMHSNLFRRAMEALDLDSSYGEYLDLIPGVTLATVNLVSMFGLHRRLRGALVGHLAAFEMTSTGPNDRYARGLRRLGFGPDALRFYDEHVEADASHEIVAARHLAGGLAEDEPATGDDILFGAAALLFVEAQLAGHVIDAWEADRSSLLRPIGLARSAQPSGERQLVAWN